jgi:hypothetical protein
VKVATLVRTLGLPEHADQKMCFAEIERRKQERTVKSRDEVAAAVARLEVKHGIEPDKDALERHLLAKQVGPDRFLLDGKVLTGAEVQAAMQEEYEADHILDDLFENEHVRGESVDKAARKLLGSRGVWRPTADEYLAACEEVSQ